VVITRSIKVIIATPLVVFGISCAACAAEDVQAPATEDGLPVGETVARTPEYTVDIAGFLSALKGAAGPEDALKIADDAITRAKTYDDLERIAAEMKRMAGEPDAKYADVLAYALARARIDELDSLAKSNDIELGRIFMTMGQAYAQEAAEMIDKAGLATTSKDLLIELSFLRYLLFRDREEAKSLDQSIDAMAETIARYSDDAARNKAKLEKLMAQFIAKSMKDEAAKVKLAYASKVDVAQARAIMEEIRAKADESFAAGDAKSAAALYEQYMLSASPYYNKEELAAKVMEIAEKYFASARYKEARRYYEFYAKRYGSSRVADYALYKIALCYANEKNYDEAVAQLESFIANNQNSVWFDKAFDNLARLFYEDYPREKAIASLEKLVTENYRKDIGDFAQILIGLLYFEAKDYDKALGYFRKVGEVSAYRSAAMTLVKDIDDVKDGSAPSYSPASPDKYRMWELYTPTQLGIGAYEVKAATNLLDKLGVVKPKRFNLTQSVTGTPVLEVSKGSKVELRAENEADTDTFTEYSQDRSDASRLPKKETEMLSKDLVSIQWKTDGGKFADENQSSTKVWQAPDAAGACTVTVRVDDFGLVRTPDKGIAKDPPREAALQILVVD